MSNGEQFKMGFEVTLHHHGGTILVHKNWGTVEKITNEYQGLKNQDNNNPALVIFEFAEHIDIVPGDVLQQKGAFDLWKVFDVEDIVEGDTYVNFEVKVDKMGVNQNRSSVGQIVFNGPNYGGVQFNASHGTQQIVINNVEVMECVNKLKELLRNDLIDVVDQEEGEQALDRIVQLSHKEINSTVISRIKEKLELVSNVFSISKDIAALAMPYLGTLLKLFGNT